MKTPNNGKQQRTPRKGTRDETRAEEEYADGEEESFLPFSPLEWEAQGKEGCRPWGVHMEQCN